MLPFSHLNLFTELTQIIGKHLPPPDPVVVDVVAPDVEAMRDAFGMKQAGEFAAAIRSFE